MKRESEPGGEHTDHNPVLNAVVGLRPIGTKNRGDGSTSIIVEPTTFYERTPGAGEGMVADIVRGLEDGGRRAGKPVDIVVKRQPGRVFGFSNRDPRSIYLNEGFPKFDPSSID